MSRSPFQAAFVDLYAVPRMNETRLKHLLARFDTPEAVLEAKQDELVTVEKVDEELASAIAGYHRSEETKQRIRQAKAAGVGTLAYGSPHYPANLKDLAHMPPVLFVRGELEPADHMAVAVVGTRLASHYGRQVAEKLGQDFARSGVCVVSGLARGIDTHAHRGVLDAQGRTIAVLGCGLDVYYPPENRRLQDEIAERGAVISEYPLGAEPLAMNFPKRNRVVSGLGRAVVVVEAGEKSGALNTVAWARDQGRDVYAVPGNVTSKQSVGTNRLLREGAKPVISAEDVLKDLGVVMKRLEREAVAVGEEERPVLDFLSGEPVHVDDICEGLGIPMAGLLSLLLQLEIKGLVRQLPGKLFVKEI